MSAQTRTSRTRASLSPDREPLIEHTHVKRMMRPASARQASVQAKHAASMDFRLTQRPASALGRMSKWPTERPFNTCTRPGSAMAHVASHDTPASGGRLSAGSAEEERAGCEHPYSSIVSIESRNLLQTGGLTAAQQLDILREQRAHSVLDLLRSNVERQHVYQDRGKVSKPALSSGKTENTTTKMGLGRLIKQHKEEILEQKEKHGVQNLQKALSDFEQQDIDRYGLSFADLFMTVASGKSIPKTDNYCDPYVIVTLKDSVRGQICREQTRVDHAKTNPVWNNTFKFNCRDLEKDAVLAFACWHKSSFGQNKDVLLGECSLELHKLTKKSTAEEVTLKLQTVIKSPEGGVPTIHIRTLYGKQEEHEVWQQTQAEERLNTLRSRQLCSVHGAIPKRNSPHRIRSSDNQVQRSRRSSFSPSRPLPSCKGKESVPDDERNMGKDGGKSSLGTLPSRTLCCKAENSTCSNGSSCAVTGQMTQSHASANRQQRAHDPEPLELTDGGYSDETVSMICTTFSAQSWKGLGVGKDVFDFLSSLQDLEKRRILFQPDILQQISSTGSAHLVFPDCETIDLEHCNGATDELLLYMTQYGGSHVKKLRIGGCNKLTLRALVTFVQKFRYISSISLQGHTSADDAWLSALASALHLQELFIASCTSITDRGMQRIAVLGGLRRLDCSKCPLISRESILALSVNCTGLESINMRGCPRVTGDAISSLFARCRLLSNVEVSGLRTISSGMFGGGRLQGLQSLDVGHCKGFDDSALQHIAGLKTLEALILCANPAISDIGLEAIASCTNLRTLSLMRCAKVSDIGLIKIARACRRLQRLHLDFCTRISDTGVSFVADFSGELEHLSVRGCPHVTSLGVRAVLKHCTCIAALDVAHSGSDENEVGAAMSCLQEERRRDYERDTIPWLVGTQGTKTWTGIEVFQRILQIPYRESRTYSLLTVYCLCEAFHHDSYLLPPPKKNAHKMFCLHLQIVLLT